MDFYLFLSWKSNEFNVLLPRPLEMYQKSWSVALIDISFNNSFFIIKEQKKNEEKNNIAINKPNVIHINKVMDIQCNFVQQSIVNNNFKSILSRIPINNEEKIFLKITNPIYIPVLKDTYTHFHFQLFTLDENKPFPIANNSDVFITLHFKCNNE